MRDIRQLHGPWCPWCYEGLHGRAEHKGHYGYRPAPRPYPPWEYDMKRPERGVEPGASCAAGAPEEWMKKYPTLVEWMVTRVWDDGKPREASTVTLSIEGGTLKGCVTDRDLKRSLFRSAENLPALLASLEKALSGGAADWRPWRK